ncbi:hypothetical protein SAMN05443579_12524 [Variovorax sp. PDC80]|uniref:hypothetical protein n=1 Tax=Variovorax sp. PDC80 TaxID=1882827 RepID=UPI0008ECDF73|nr:hypothetical protein [Variovorax sp. PDC80]SFQ15249.1 hypothetical protein SAMN05443579_12524 [Variovorax sp. PDC80]
MTAAPAATELPEALRPWHPWLAWFAPELTGELGALLQRMQPLLGRFRGQVKATAPEFDGLDDLRRRGRYERLLATEWLLADELPDEFLRRAASSEHLFLAPRPRAREAEKGIVALFDAGPLQWGAPRLGQLALWILLARRAAQTGSLLQWGTLQQPGVLRDAQDAKQLRALLLGRSFVPADAAQAAAWRLALEKLERAPGECWLIGEAAVDPPAAERWTSHRVRLRRAVQGDVLEVSLSDVAGVRHAQLPLPATKAAVRLLKGEFAPSPPKDLHQRHRARVSLQRPPVIGWQGRHVAVPLLDQPGAAVYFVPQQGQKKAGKIGHQHWRDQAAPLALAFGGKRLGGVLNSEAAMYFWQVPGLAAIVEAQEEDRLSAPPGLGVWLPMAWLRHRGVQKVCLLDRAGRLVSWTARAASRPKPEEASPALVERSVLCISQWADDALVYVARRSGQLMLCRLSVDTGPATVLPIGTAPEDTRVFLAGGRHWRLGLGACAVRLSADDGGEGRERWRIHAPNPDYRGPYREHPHAWHAFEIGAHKAIALIFDAHRGRFAMTGLSSDRSALVLHSSAGAETVYHAPERIEKIAVCPNTGLAAMLTLHRQLILFDLSLRVLLGFFHAEGGANG